MQPETRTADAKGRVLLSNKLANATLLVEQMSDTEYRVRLAKTIPVDEIQFTEEFPKVLSDEEREWFIQLLENPPPMNDALRKLMDSGSTGHA